MKKKKKLILLFIYLRQLSPQKNIFFLLFTHKGKKRLPLEIFRCSFFFPLSRFYCFPFFFHLNFFSSFFFDRNELRFFKRSNEWKKKFQHTQTEKKKKWCRCICCKSFFFFSTRFYLEIKI